MYKTKIVEIGPIVEDFAEEFLLVLFGPQAMAELRDICVIHESSDEPKNVIQKNGRLTIGSQEYHILDVVMRPIQTLNHWGIFLSILEMAKTMKFCQERFSLSRRCFQHWLSVTRSHSSSTKKVSYSIVKEGNYEYF